MENRRILDKEPTLNDALPRIKEIIFIKSFLKKLSLNQEREDKLYDNYGKKLVSILRKRKD